jgi:hypothetical protein
MTTAPLTTTLDDGWLDYAREVVGDGTHRALCERAGGSPEHPGVDATDVRWPGYLGERVMRGTGLLCVGNIHRDFASGNLRSWHRDQLVDATRGWRDGSVDDASYLAAVRRVYLAGLSGWRVGLHIGHVVEALGLDLLQVAYVNAARCQYPEVPPTMAAAPQIKVRLQRLCLQRFPVDRLVRLLDPRLVLFTSTTAYDAAVELEGSLGVTTVCMHQLNGLLARPLTIGTEQLPVGTRREVWVEAVARHTDDRS